MFYLQGKDAAAILDILSSAHFSVRFALCLFAPTLEAFWSALSAPNFDILTCYDNGHAGTTKVSSGSLPSTCQPIAIGALAGFIPFINSQMSLLLAARMRDCMDIGAEAVGLTADELRQLALPPAALIALAALDALKPRKHKWV